MSQSKGGGLDGGFAPTPPVRTAVIGDLYRAVPIFFYDGFGSTVEFFRSGSRQNVTDPNTRNETDPDPYAWNESLLIPKNQCFGSA